MTVLSRWAALVALNFLVLGIIALVTGIPLRWAKGVALRDPCSSTEANYLCQVELVPGGSQVTAESEAVADSAELGELSYSLHKSGSDVEFKLTNNSSAAVNVLGFSILHAEQTGHWIYLYDPETRSIMRGWESDGLIPAGTKSAGHPRVLIPPKGALTRTVKISYLLQYFFTRPNRCYLLIAQYKELGRRRSPISSPSNAVKVCDGGE